jgi:hypothetical protein
LVPTYTLSLLITMALVLEPSGTLLARDTHEVLFNTAPEGEVIYTLPLGLAVPLPVVAA